VLANPSPSPASIVRRSAALGDAFSVHGGMLPVSRMLILPALLYSPATPGRPADPRPSAPLPTGAMHLVPAGGGRPASERCISGSAFDRALEDGSQILGARLERAGRPELGHAGNGTRLSQRFLTVERGACFMAGIDQQLGQRLRRSFVIVDN